MGGCRRIITEGLGVGMRVTFESDGKKKRRRMGT